MQQLAEILGHPAISADRHEIIRTGPRAEIPHHVRAAVWWRDRGQCQLCHNNEQANPWELDHIKPWSAGGPDTTDNLRVLCQQHNQSRSNFVDGTEQRGARPATWWCTSCFSATEDRPWTWLPSGLPVCPLHSIQEHCRVVRGWQRSREWGLLTDWHKRYPIEAATSVAYCAHCDRPALTDRPL